MNVHAHLGPLSYAVRPRPLLKYLGQLALVLGLLTLAPTLAAILFGDYGHALRCALVALLLGGAGLALGRLPVHGPLQLNEALVIVALAFAVAALSMVWPLMSAGLGPLDALFEAVSAVTTTGLTTLPGVAGLDPGFLFTRAWMQWVGGLGVVVFSVALLFGPGQAARRLTLGELGGDDDLVGSTRLHARRVLGVYLALTLLAVGLLRLAGAPWQTALLHGLAAISTGGFSSLDQGLAGLPPTAQAVTTLIGLCGAISLGLYYRAWRGRGPVFRAALEFRALLAACALAGLGLAVSLHATAELDWAAALRHGLLLGISAQTTTGYASLEPAGLPAGTLLLLILAMSIGGSLGSTSGGFKLLRLLILLQLLRLQLWRTRLPPHAVLEPSLGGEPLLAVERERALLLILLMLLVIGLSWLAFVCAGEAPLAALFEVVSATTTTGLSSGVSRPDLAAGLKLLLCLDMWAGRVEFLALLVLLYPATWIGHRTRNA